MAYQVLARKYRPQRFADVAGQDHVTVTLMNALTQQRIAHGYIFSGHRGIGKTTIARILACALNCRNPIGSEKRPTAEPCEVCESCLEIRAGNSTDVIEIDAATNRGIDEIRELRDAARYRPSRDKYKIYILDEAHQITDAAFNALLKTLEEPPDHIVFMMATTQPEDIPQTVRSRCQVFNFHAVKLVDILAELRGIADHEGVHADDAALSLLAEAGDGSMRDALSIMDQAIASAPLEDGHARLDANQIRELMGAVPNATFERILMAVDQNRSAEVMTVANDLMDAGNSPAQLARQCVRYLRSCVIAKIAGLTPEANGEFHGTELLQISADEQRRAARTATLFTEEELTRFLQTMLRTFDELGYRQEQRFHFELGLLKLVHLRRLLPVEEVLSTLPAPATGRTQASISAPRPTANLTAPVIRPADSRPAFHTLAPDKLRRFTHIEADRTPMPVPAPVPTPRDLPTPAPVFEPAAASVPPERGPVEGYAVSSTPAPQSVILSAAEGPAVSSPLAQTPVILSEGEAVVEGPAHSSTPAKNAVILSEGAAAAEGPRETQPHPNLPDLSNPAPTPTRAAQHLQTLATDALSAAPGQTSAADALHEATFTLADSTLTIQTQVSAKMLSIVLNPDAERILRATIRTADPTLKLAILPGTPTSKAAAKPRTAKAGSAESKARQHPMVQQAQQLFEAEIRNVIDLSDTK